MKRVAVIEDDVDLFAWLKLSLERERFAVSGICNGGDAIEFCRRERPDLVILDVMTPDRNGIDICRNIRAHPELMHIPVVFLGAQTSGTDRAVGLEVGANDYITKPFSMTELLARVKIHLRERAAPPNKIEVGDLEIDRDRCRVRLKGRPLRLTATEFRLLDFLASRAGVVFSRQQLIDSVWGRSGAVTDRIVDVYVLRLRRKLEYDPEDPPRLRCVRGFGYSFEPNRP